MLIGNSLLASEGGFWRRQRRLSQPAFHRQRINAYTEVMVAATERILANWRDGETRDIRQEMMRLHCTHGGEPAPTAVYRDDRQGVFAPLPTSGEHRPGG